MAQDSFVRNGVTGDSFDFLQISGFLERSMVRAGGLLPPSRQ